LFYRKKIFWRQTVVQGAEKSSPLKFFAVFSATLWNFNLNFTDVFTETIYT